MTAHFNIPKLGVASEAEGAGTTEEKHDFSETEEPKTKLDLDLTDILVAAAVAHIEAWLVERVMPLI